MSPETDRIPVPTNGKGPHPVAVPTPGQTPTADLPEPVETTMIVTPAQLAVGFGILASLILMLVAWLRRRGRSGSRGVFGRR